MRLADRYRALDSRDQFAVWAVAVFAVALAVIAAVLLAVFGA